MKKKKGKRGKKRFRRRSNMAQPFQILSQGKVCFHCLFSKINIIVHM